NKLFLGESETTIGMKYTSTTDGRNAAVHERSPVAGSGEKRASSTSASTTATIYPGQTTTRPAGEIFRGVDRKLSLAGGPGDKKESHVSEEELGIASQDDDDDE